MSRASAGPLSAPWILYAMVALLAAALYTTQSVLSGAESYERHYLFALVVNAATVLLLITLIIANALALFRQWRAGQTGSRLSGRLLSLFLILSLLPLSILFAFSLSFLQRGIASWFDVRVEEALESAMDLGQASFDERMRTYARYTQRAAERLEGLEEERTVSLLNELLYQLNAQELTLLTGQDQIIAAASVDPLRIVPDMPDDWVLMRAGQSGHYVGLDLVKEGGLVIRVVVHLDDYSALTESLSERRFLQALYPISERINQLADRVQESFDRHRELAYLRTPLTSLLSMALLTVLLLTSLFAVWIAFYASRRLVAPIVALADATEAVAAGDLKQRLIGFNEQRDELGYLVRSFNGMIFRLDEAREALEQQRTYLQAVLERISSGVLSIDADQVLKTANAKAAQILEIDFSGYTGGSMAAVVQQHHHLMEFCEAVLSRLERAEGEWQLELVLVPPSGSKTLMLRGARLPEGGGGVIVFDDVSHVLKAQKDAAWSEVAQRMAHEIKNPLTPIKLSAERLQRKVLKLLPEKQAALVDRSTRTIITQVDAMKAMVDAFADYARAPQMRSAEVQLNHLVRDVTELYRASPSHIQLHLAKSLPRLSADAGRLRQVLHNLIRNALESLDGRTGEIHVTTSLSLRNQRRWVELRVADNGPGIPKAILNTVFEPYVSSKSKGTGLGLAVVKKIIEEHGGSCSVANRQSGGAEMTIAIPVELHDPDFGAPERGIA